MRCLCCGELTLPYGGEDVCECSPCRDCGACCHTAHTDGCRAEYDGDEDA